MLMILLVAGVAIVSFILSAALTAYALLEAFEEGRLTMKDGELDIKTRSEYIQELQAEKRSNREISVKGHGLPSGKYFVEKAERKL